MPTEDRITTLEQQFMNYMADNNQQMATLNRVIAQQELNLREIQKSQTILLGIASGQEHDIKEIKARLERLDLVEVRLEGIEQRLDEIKALLTNKSPTPPEQ
jgi:hypothetical protein